MEPFLGEIKLVAFAFAPHGWAFCDGQQLQIAQNSALFSLLNVQFGGDGKTNFNLPDLRGRSPLFPMDYKYGVSAGQETVTLTKDNIPAHNHLVLVSKANGNQVPPTSNFLSATKPDSTFTNGFKAFVTSTPNSNMNSNVVGTFGTSAPHQNMQPSLVLNYCIATMGVYPIRD